MEEDTVPKRPSTFPLFSKNLVLQPMTVINFANESKKQFEDFIEAFRKRIVVEIDYANNLMGVSKSLDKYIQPGSDKAISFICSAFQVENEQRAQQAKQLAESLKTQIYEVCLNASKQETNVIKKAEKDIKSMLKRFDQIKQNLELTFDNYEKMGQQFDQLIITKSYIKHTSSLPQQKKTKLLTKTISNINQRKTIERQYTTAHKDYNAFVEQYNKQSQQLLNEVQTQLRDQISLQADCLRKLIVAEVSMFKNIEYDLINISKQMEGLDTQRDLEVVCGEAKESLENLIVDDEENTNPDSIKDKRKSIQENSSTISSSEKDLSLLNKLKEKQLELNKGMMASSIKTIEENMFTQLIVHKKSKEFKELIEARWNELNMKENQQNYEKKEQQEVSESDKKEQQSQDVNGQKQNSLKSILLNYLQNTSVCQELYKIKKQEEKADASNQIHQNFNIITRYIHEIFTGKNITQIESKKKNKQNEQIMESPFMFIKKVLSVSHFYRLFSYSFIESFRTHQMVLIDSLDKVQQIAKFLNALLTKSYKENDVFVLRGLLFLIFTFYYIDSNTKRHMASEPSIYKNSLWKKQDFWDAALFESTYEEMLSFGPQKDESYQETILREKNLLFSQLASYCHYMIMLGISSKNVRQIVGRFCRLYQMSDQQNRDLSKMITNTVKQYKEIILVNIKDTSGKGEKESEKQKEKQ